MMFIVLSMMMMKRWPGTDARDGKKFVLMVKKSKSKINAFDVRTPMLPAIWSMHDARISV